MAVSQTKCESWRNRLSADVPRGQWLLGRVVEVIEGEDGFVKVQVTGSVVTRTITKIYPFEVNEGNQNIMTVLYGRRE